MSTDAPQQVNHISTVRNHLLDTLAALRDKANPMDIDRARAVADVARVLVDSAKVEVAYLVATQQVSTPFLEVPPDQQYLPGAAVKPGNGISSITRHTLKG